MSRKIFVLGGAKSGKSRFAQNLAESFQGKRTYIATALPIDDEMKDKIEKHKNNRNPELWHNLIEEPYELPEILMKLNNNTDVVLVDCLTVWLSNIFMKFEDDYDKILEKINLLENAIMNLKYNIVLVSNEVGMGIVPANKLARIFREFSGIMNQKVASISDEFYLFFCGYSIRLK